MRTVKVKAVKTLPLRNADDTDGAELRGLGDSIAFSLDLRVAPMFASLGLLLVAPRQCRQHSLLVASRLLLDLGVFELVDSHLLPILIWVNCWAVEEELVGPEPCLSLLKSGP